MAQTTPPMSPELRAHLLSPQWWVPGPPPPVPELQALKNIVEGYTGNQFVIPIFTKSPERKAWDAAVQWLTDRAAADAEWPWPRRADYNYADGHGTRHDWD